MATDEEVGARLKLKDRAQFQSDARAARREVKQLGDEGEKSGKRAERSSRGWLTLRGSFGAVRAGALLAAGAIGVVGLAVGIAGVKMIGLASNANETASALTTVMGPAIGDTRKVLGQLNHDFGIPVQTLEQATVGFGAFGRQAGVSRKELGKWSTDLVAAGLDLGSFWNVDTADTMAAIQSGLSGEVEPLRRFGIFMSESALSAEAARMGYKGAFSELKEGQKLAVRQSFILKNLGAAQGDMARTADSPANAWRRFRGELTQAATSIGQIALPTLGKFVAFLGTKLQPVIDYLTANTERWGRKTSDWFGGVANKVRWLWIAFQSGGPERVVAYLDDMTGAGGRLNWLFDKTKRVVNDLVTIWRDGLQPALAAVPGPLAAIASPLKLTDNLLHFTAKHAKTLGPLLAGLAVGWATYKAAQIASNVVSAATNALAFITIARTEGLAVAQGMATASTGELAVGTGILNAVMDANPVMLVVVAIAALAAGFLFAYKHSDGFRRVVDATWQALQRAWDWMLKIGKWMLTLNPMTGPLFLFLTHLPEILGAARDAFGWVVDKVKAVWRWMKKAFDMVKGLIDRIKHIPGAGVAGKVLSHIPGLATGGTIQRGGLAVTGEHGPELGYWPAGSMVLPTASVQPLAALALAGGSSEPMSLAPEEVAPVELTVMLDGKVLAKAVHKHTDDEVARR